MRQRLHTRSGAEGDHAAAVTSLFTHARAPNPSQRGEFTEHDGIVCRGRPTVHSLRVSACDVANCPSLVPSASSMPELPEVECSRRLCAAHGVGHRVVKVVASEDDKVFPGASSAAWSAALLNATLLNVHRRGKHMWWELDRKPFPVFHHGMTGSFAVRGVGATHYQSFAVDQSTWPPRFTKLLVAFSNGVEVAFADPRRFARLRLEAEPLTMPPISLLGFDPLLSPISAVKFAALLAKRSAPVKALLLDQSVCAGVGNWVADEALYQARVHPETPGNALGAEASAALLSAVLSVCTTAAAVDADSARFPAGWLFHKRWGKKAGTMEGHPLAFETVGGRTSCFVPALQLRVGPPPLKRPPKALKKRAAADEEEGADVADVQGDAASAPSKRAVPAVPKPAAVAAGLRRASSRLRIAL